MEAYLSFLDIDVQDTKKVNYVQISLDSYNHLSGLEGQVNNLESQVKTLENQVKDLEGKLASAYLEVSTKENLVKQHEKFAEEAVSGQILMVEDSSTLSSSIRSYASWFCRYQYWIVKHKIKFQREQNK